MRLYVCKASFEYIWLFKILRNTVAVDSKQLSFLLIAEWYETIIFENVYIVDVLGRPGYGYIISYFEPNIAFVVRFAFDCQEEPHRTEKNK